MRNLLLIGLCALAVVVCCPARCAARTVSGSEALQMALSAAATVESSGEIPDRIYMRRGSSGSIRMSADDALVFFCRLLAGWQEASALPQRVELPRGAVGSRRAARTSPRTTDGGPDMPSLSTASLARQCRSAVSLVGRLGSVPQGVWVDDQRLSAAQFMGAVVMCLAAGARTNALPEKATVPSWRGPSGWPAFEPLPSGDGVALGWSLPARGATAAMTLQPNGSRPLSGIVTLTVSYPVRGALIEVLLDGTRKWMANQSPFSFTWDTRAVKDGSHTISVRAGLGDGSGQASLERAFVTKNAGPSP